MDIHKQNFWERKKRCLEFYLAFIYLHWHRNWGTKPMESSAQRRWNGLTKIWHLNLKVFWLFGFAYINDCNRIILNRKPNRKRASTLTIQRFVVLFCWHLAILNIDFGRTIRKFSWTEVNASEFFPQYVAVQICFVTLTQNNKSSFIDEEVAREILSFEKSFNVFYHNWNFFLRKFVDNVSKKTCVSFYLKLDLFAIICLWHIRKILTLKFN